MSLLLRHPRLRWLVPVVALTLVVGIPAVSQRAATADPGLPPRTAEELLTDLAQAKPQPLSGTIAQSMNLGLPALPQIGHGPADFSPLGLLSGDHTWRVWTNASDSLRVAQVNGSEEVSVIHSPSETWTWNSATREAVHATHPDTTRPTNMPTTPAPDELARRILAELDSSTAVSTDGSTTVAGRAAYQLVLTPKAEGTKIASVRLAIDAETKTALRLLVTARGASSPAIQVAFTSIDYSMPAAERFTFTPPADATLTEADDLPSKTTNPPTPTMPEPTTPDAPAGAKVVGTGWTQVRVIPGVGDPTQSEDPAIVELLGQLPTVSGDWGQGKLLDTTLVSAVLTTDGRLAVGAVEPALLYAALR